MPPMPKERLPLQSLACPDTLNELIVVMAGAEVASVIVGGTDDADNAVVSCPGPAYVVEVRSRC